MAAIRQTEDEARDDAIVISLTAATADKPLPLPSRRLVLTRNSPTVRIGRASKVPTKGFVATHDNAWFESPVMSRLHAEFVADFDSKTISIKDVGSLHGTWHTRDDDFRIEEKLKQGELVELGSGDRLRFGIDIFRSKQTFPPCTATLTIEKQLARIEEPVARRASTNRFSVPDDIDSEDVGSDSDSIIEATGPSSRATRNHGAFETIDLTGGPRDSFSSRHSDIIDLTSEPEQLVRPSEPSSAAEISSHYDYHTATMDLAFDMDDVHATAPEAFDLDLDEDLSSAGEIPFDIESEAESEISSLITEDSAEISDQGSDMETDSLDYGDEENSDLDPYGDEFGQASSDEEDTGIMSDPPSPISETSEREASPSSFLFQTAPVPTNELNLSFCETMPSITNDEQPLNPPEPTALLQSPTQSTTIISTAEALGQKTGKIDYFKAREENRAAIMGNMSNPPVSAIRETLCNREAMASDALPQAPKTLPEIQNENSGSKIASNSCTKTASERMPDVASVEVNLEPATAHEDSAWTTSGMGFINNPNSVLPLTPAKRSRLQSPDFDMTSAYAFEQSKLGADPKALQSCRRLLIRDLLAQEPTDSSSTGAATEQIMLSPQSNPTPPKRSFDDAFPESDHDEIQGNSTIIDLPTAAADTEQSIPESKPSLVAGTPCEPTSMILTAPKRSVHLPQPKRRRLAEVAACLALGGAGVLSALIYTAPSFA